MIRIKLSGVLAAAALAAASAIAGAAPAGAAPAGAAGNYTCSGGSFFSPSIIPAGTYKSMTVTGFCAPAPGTVMVRNLTVAPGGGLASMVASSTLTVTGNVEVETGGMFAIGCGTSVLNDATCPDNPEATSTDSIGGNLDTSGAVLVIVHFSSIGGNAKMNGGGGGITCDNLPGVPTPPFVDFDYDAIGGNASVKNLVTCWDGFSDSTIGGNVTFDNNQTNLPLIGDGNFVGGNVIAGNLRCFGDSPKPHLSDVTHIPNSVGGHTAGQCVAEI
jgi:hypothetical protein